MTFKLKIDLFISGYVQLSECLKSNCKLNIIGVNEIDSISGSFGFLVCFIDIDKEYMMHPIQKIIFGSPGTGKSYKIVNPNNGILAQLGIDKNSENCVKAVFHPEYTYGDFMGKLLPLTQKDKVKYNYHEGHFLTALAQAYKNILIDAENPQCVALIIDELNRGNSSAIFGTIFQLLDREEDGWSSYEITISDMEIGKLCEKIGLKVRHIKQDEKIIEQKYEFNGKSIKNGRIYELIGRKNIKLPPNLSIIATINTSDTSIYYMDSAFKRRWEWEFVDVDNAADDANDKNLYNNQNWVTFINNLNRFIKDEYRSIRKIEDKQVGYWFIRGDIITKDQIKNKVMFFIWDSVFTNNKSPLVKLLGVKDNELITFGDFTKSVDKFVEKILKYS